MRHVLHVLHVRMRHVHEKYSTHIVNYEKKIYDNKKYLNSATWRPSTYNNPSGIIRTKKAYGLEISQSIIYVKQYFYVFLYIKIYYTSTKLNKSLI